MRRFSLLALPLLFACATTPPADSRFPSKDSLTALAATQAAIPESPPVLEASSWTFTTPAASTWVDAPLAEPAPWMAKAAETGATLSTSLSCYAQELAAFFRVHGVYPGRRVGEFMAARCGTPILSSGARVFTVKASEETPLEEITERYQADLDEMIAQAAEAGTVGLGMSRVGGDLAFAAVYGRATTEILAGAPTPDEAGNVVIRARTPLVGTFIAAASHGRYSLRPCTFDASVELPELELSCPVDPADETAWISVVVYEKDRVFGRQVLSVLARSPDAAVETYERFDYLAGADVDKGDVVGLLNHVRAKAGAPPVSLEEKQSVVVRDLAPHLVSASLAGDAAKSDHIGLGIVAGWDVDGVVQRGSFTSELARSARELTAADFLMLSLERPLGRETLLDDEVDRIAVGSFALAESQTNGLVISTYALFEPTDFKAASDQIYARLQELRPKGKAGLGRHRVNEVLVARGVEERRFKPEVGLNRLMKMVQEQTGQAVGGWVIRTTDLRVIELPENLLNKNLGVAIAVGHERQKGAAWGSYVVMIAYTESPSRFAELRR
jgi:hypothetical protein